ncbi:DUF4064 domain-containing protein [Salinicoccus carnicancri]|uniref:DUF4064 domain-containing protein n=1 Tax=Salinicoccus carnicancri TaxID=558170 RepID=UPI000303EB06|nr:DUF4064 domain-containing protein [Salinicoccus carnicancri]
MAKKHYTQTVEPVSRIAERIFGWLAWIALLAITGLILFFSLVMVNDPAIIETVRMQVQDAVAQQGSGDLSADQMTDAVLSMLNSSWMVALYLAVPLIIGLFGLLTLRRRILSGFLLLIAGVLTAPLVFAVITGLIPLFFVIAAILLFVRKDRVITHDDGYPAGEERRRERFAEDRRTPESDRTAGTGSLRDHDQDDVKTYEREPQNRDRSYGEDDLESTRQYRAIDDETEREYRDRQKDGTAGLSAYDDERSERGDDRYVDEDNIGGEPDRYVDGNIDSQEATEPVTEEEYTRRGGTGRFNDGVSGDDGETPDDTDEKRRGSLKNSEYDYDASRERRNNLDRRNNGE